MNLKEFSPFLKQLFEDVCINQSKLYLNGSFADSYYASDIDLYEACSISKLSDVEDKIKFLSDKYNLLEVKVVDNKDSNKYHTFDNIKLSNNKIKLVKIDMIVLFFVYPYECSIIYDFAPKDTMNTDSVISQMMEDVLSGKYNDYKSVKRMNSIMRLKTGKSDPLFDSIVSDTDIGVLYLCINRLETIKKVKHFVGKDEYDKMYWSIQDDLRRIGIHKTTGLDNELNNRIQIKLKNA
jgi:hypothetical protein